MKPILEQVAESLDAKKFNYEHREEYNLIHFEMSGTVADLNVIIRIQDDNLLLFTSVLEVNLPERSHMRVIDAINDINKDALISTLYLDKKERRVVSQSFMVVNGDTMDEDLFSLNLSSVLSRVDTNAENIIRIAYANNEETLSQLLLRKQIEDVQQDETMC